MKQHADRFFFSQNSHSLTYNTSVMSKSRKKLKKQQKKNNRISNANPQPLMPKARRKGGQYIYPAGAYRNAMQIITGSVPLIEETAEPISITMPDVPAAEVLRTETAETKETALNRNLITGMILTAALACAFAFSNMKGQAALYTKLSTRTVALKEQLNIEDAAPLEDLEVSINTDRVIESISEFLDEQSGKWGIYIKLLDTDQTITIDDHQMPSASLIKLFVAGCYLEETKEGRLTPDARSEQDLEMMITWSDNDAWEDLETIIGSGDYIKGLQKVTEFAEKHGYKNSGRLIGDETVFSENADNLTSPSDVGRLMEEIYRGTFVSEEASEKLLSLLKEQHIITKIPAGLPEGIESANKTGELIGIENDAAIVYGKNTDYILVIMTEENEVGTDPLSQLSALVYRELNPGA